MTCNIQYIFIFVLISYPGVLLPNISQLYLGNEINNLSSMSWVNPRVSFPENVHGRHRGASWWYSEPPQLVPFDVFRCLSLSLYLEGPLSRGNSLWPLVSMISLFWSLPKAHGQRWVMEHRSTGKLKALPSDSAHSSPQRPGTMTTLLLMLRQSACNSHTLIYLHLWTR